MKLKRCSRHLSAILFPPQRHGTVRAMQSGTDLNGGQMADINQWINQLQLMVFIPAISLYAIHCEEEEVRKLTVKLKKNTWEEAIFY